MIQHVVLLRFKDETSAATRAELERGFAALLERVSEVQAIEWGTNVSPEGLSKGFTHCFLVSFGSSTDRDAYLPHVAHQAFVAQLQPWLADVLVVDYECSTSL
jgi:hypothetical protein